MLPPQWLLGVKESRIISNMTNFFSSIIHFLFRLSHSFFLRFLTLQCICSLCATVHIYCRKKGSRKTNVTKNIAMGLALLPLLLLCSYV